MKLSITIPAKNEEKRISKTLEEYVKFFKEIKRQRKIEDFDIVVVINKTTDNTEKIVREKSKKYKEIRYLNFKEGGKGFAIKQGFKNALKRDADLIGFVDADMSTSPQAFYDLVENIKNYDGIIASRYIKNAIIKEKQPVSRVIVSRVGNLVIRSLFLMPYRDTQCGAKLFRKKAIKKILSNLGITQWAIDIDLLYQAKRSKLRIREFPTVWDNALGSQLNVGKTSVQVFLAVVQLRVLNSTLKRMWNLISPTAKRIHKLVR